MTKARVVQTPGQPTTKPEEGADLGAAGTGDKLPTDLAAGADQGSDQSQDLAAALLQLETVIAERDELKVEVTALQAQVAELSAQLKAAAKGAKTSQRPAAIPPAAEAPYLTDKGWIIPEPKKD